MTKQDDQDSKSDSEGATKATGSADTSGARRVNRRKSGGLLSFKSVALISVLVVGGAVGYEIWKNPELVGGSRVGGTPNLDDTPAGDQLEASERYADNLRQQNQQGAQDALDDGSSFVATPDEPLRDIDTPAPTVEQNPNRPLPPANPTPTETEQPRTVVIQRPAAQQPRQQQQRSQQSSPNYSNINQLAQLMAAQQQGLNQAWQALPSGVTVVVDQELYKEPEPVAVEPPGPVNVGGVQMASNVDVLARVGDVVLASTIITNDSDTPGPVVVEIRRGPLTGARLVGGFQPNANNTHLIVQFNLAVLPDGSEVPVSAYAVDARQRSLAVRTDLDRRLFERYAPRVAAAFASGVGEALSDPGSTLVDLGGATGVTRPARTVEQGIYQGVAQVGNDLAQEFVQSAPSGPLISLRSRQVIGVLFTSNVQRQ